MPVDKAITREKLILAGERLIAEKGLDGVSLRQVNIAAKQKNTSAALYHFGDKQGLIMAIFDYRLSHVDQLRHKMLDEDESTPRSIIKAWIFPDAHEITSTKGGSHHARFLAVLANSPEFNFNELWQRESASSYLRVANGLRIHLPDIPEQIFTMRFGMAMIQSIYAMADQEEYHRTTSRLFINHLVDVIEAIFAAPISRETAEELTQAKIENKGRLKAID